MSMFSAALHCNLYVYNMFYFDRLLDTIDTFAEKLPLDNNGQITLKVEQLTVHSAVINRFSQGYTFSEGKLQI